MGNVLEAAYLGVNRLGERRGKGGRGRKRERARETQRPAPVTHFLQQGLFPKFLPPLNIVRTVRDKNPYTRAREDDLSSNITRGHCALDLGNAESYGHI